MFLLLDPCDYVTCAVPGESCFVEQRQFEDVVFVGVCRCGTAATCEPVGDVCDVANNVCKCGSLDACVPPKVCSAGECIGN